MRVANDELTVEQLALEVGLPTTTIRMYQTKGVLHPPRRRGRSARYDHSHVERLHLVQRLQARGFSLPAIADLVAAHETGNSVADVLGLGGRSAEADEWVPVTVRDLRAIVPARDLRLGLLRRSAALGLVRWRRGRPYTRRWALQSGQRMADLAIPRSEVLDQYAKVRSVTDALAQDFVETFQRHVWSQVTSDVDRPDTLESLRQSLTLLTETAELTLLGALRDSLRAAAEEFARSQALMPIGTPPFAGETAEDESLEDPDDETIAQFVAEADAHEETR